MLYNVIVKFITESADVVAAACTCPAGSSVKCLGKRNHVGAILFALEDFSRKNLKTFVEPTRDSSTNPTPIEKTLVKKLNLGMIHLQKLSQKIIVMTHVHQMINIFIMIV